MILLMFFFYIIIEIVTVIIIKIQFVWTCPEGACVSGARPAAVRMVRIKKRYIVSEVVLERDARLPPNLTNTRTMVRHIRVRIREVYMRQWRIRDVYLKQGGIRDVYMKRRE